MTFPPGEKVKTSKCISLMSDDLDKTFNAAFGQGEHANSTQEQNTKNKLIE